MSPALTILALGPLNSGSVDSLRAVASAVEVIELDLPPLSHLPASSAVLNRAIEAASYPWILVLRGGERISADLAAEIAHVAVEIPGSWGFRLRSVPYYAGRPLLLGDRSDGEIRLIHRRRCRFVAGKPEVNVPGTIVRLQEPLRHQTFATPEEHRGFLAAEGVPHSFLRRLLLFTRNAIVSGALLRSPSTLRYLWIEAAFDHPRLNR